MTGGAVLVALVGGFWLVRLGLRPLRDMERTAESIADGNLTERVPGENETTEVGRLARTLNVMLTRIESAFSARLASERRLRASEQRLRQFVADASHELRTPIAAISAYAELFGRGASEQKADLERLMGGIRTETARMEHLVADLLLLARLDEGRPMEQRSVDLVALCAEAVHTASTVGPEWPVTFEAIRAHRGDGRRHQPPPGHRQPARPTSGPTPRRAPTGPGQGGAVTAPAPSITVADNGPGMDPEEAEHVFERFYRSDPSRSRTHGGAGLGLSIVSAIVAAHGGTVSAAGRRRRAAPPSPSACPRTPPTRGRRGTPTAPEPCRRRLDPARVRPDGPHGDHGWLLNRTELTLRHHRAIATRSVPTSRRPTSPRTSRPTGRRTAADVDIVIPVYNEDGAAGGQRHRACAPTSTRRSPSTATITIADNASTDGTWQIAADLAATLDGVDAIHLDEKGRGRALRAAWSPSTASVVAYMDVDLATGLDALLPLVAPLLSGHSDWPSAPGWPRRPRGPGRPRELISRGYNLLLRSALRSSCTDAQCGFKAMRRDAAVELLPLVEDDEWFFDTELLVTAQRIGLRIHEVPVDWVDDPDSRVDVLHTALMDLRGVWRLLGPTASARGCPTGPSDRHPTRRGRRAHRRRRRPGHRCDRVPIAPATPSDRAGGASARSARHRGVRRRAAPLRRRRRGQHRGLPGAVRRPRARPGQLSRPTRWPSSLCSLGNTAVHRGMAGTARPRPRPAGIGWSPAAALLGVSLAFTTAALAATRAAGPDLARPRAGRRDRGQRRRRRHPVRHPPHLGVPARVRDQPGLRVRASDRRTPSATDPWS